MPLLDVKENDQVLLVKEIQDEKVLFVTDKGIKLLSKDLQTLLNEIVVPDSLITAADFQCDKLLVAFLTGKLVEYKVQEDQIQSVAQLKFEVEISALSLSLCG